MDSSVKIPIWKPDFSNGGSHVGQLTHVGPFEAQAGFKQTDRLREVASPLVVFQQFVQLLGVNNDVEAANLRKSEFLFLQAGTVNLLPDSKNYLMTQLFP